MSLPVQRRLCIVMNGLTPLLRRIGCLLSYTMAGANIRRVLRERSVRGEVSDAPLPCCKPIQNSHSSFLPAHDWMQFINLKCIDVVKFLSEFSRHLFIHMFFGGDYVILNYFTISSSSSRYGRSFYEKYYSFRPVGVRNIAVSASVCMSVCICVCTQAYFKNWMSKVHLIFYTYCLWSPVIL